VEPLKKSISQSISSKVRRVKDTELRYQNATSGQRQPTRSDLVGPAAWTWIRWSQLAERGDDDPGHRLHEFPGRDVDCAFVVVLHAASREVGRGAGGGIGRRLSGPPRRFARSGIAPDRTGTCPSDQSRARGEHLFGGEWMTLLLTQQHLYGSRTHPGEGRTHNRQSWARGPREPYVVQRYDAELRRHADAHA
jgi:hypothetical protein